MGWTVKNIFPALLFLLFVFSIQADPTTNSAIKFIPSKYTIQINTEKEHFEKADQKDLKYTGEVVIEFEMVGAPADKPFNIELNTNPKTEIANGDLKLEAKDGANFKAITCSHELGKGKLTLKCGKENAAYKDFKLTVKYSNPFGEDMTGFYRSSYEDSDKKTKWLLTTHFEPIYARNAFPCFDKPDLKAKFKVSIKVPKEITTVLSNTDLDKSIADGDFKIYNFKQTDISMSTYLVAFTASQLKETTAITFKSIYGTGSIPEDKKLRTFGRKEIIDRGDAVFAQNVAKLALEGLTEYFGKDSDFHLGYAFQKVDQVGIPDFSAGAMENFGHISFREQCLFYNKETSSTMTKQSNLLTIVHELVHQWFGNLVTLQSWDYIWLNEAFANYLEYVIASKFKTSDVDTSNWQLMEQLVVREIHSAAFEADGLSTSTPLTHAVTDENLIVSLFNDIPYAKGSAVLRMWDLSMEANKFQEGLKKYISARKEQSATPEQLREALKTPPGLDENFFNTWTEQAGYPVVQVKKIKEETYELSQSRFLWDKANPDTKWYIPITYSTNEKLNFETKPTAYLAKDAKLELKDVKGNWIVVNNQQAGYYRVNYEKENWDALIKALNTSASFSGIHVLNRAQIVNDVFSLARSLQKNYVNYSTAFDLAQYLKKEKNFLPLKTALNAFEFMLPKLTKDATLDNFKAYVLDIIKPHYKKLKETGNEHMEKLQRAEISRLACALDFPACVNEAKDMFKSDEYGKFPDVQETILCTVMRSSNKADWEKVFNKYKEEKDSSLKVMYLRALGCTSDKTLAKAFLEMTLKQDSGIRKQDLGYAFSAVCNGNSKNLETAFEFIETKFAEIAKTYGGLNPLGKAIVTIARRLNTEDQYKRLEDLVDKVKKNQDIKGTEESLGNALRIANGNVLWNKERIKQIELYFGGSSAIVSSLSLLLMCLFFVLRF